MQNLVKTDWRSVAELLRIFDFQNGGHSPSWIWYDVIAGNPRLVFDRPNILLKLHVNHIYTLQGIAIFYIRPVYLEIAYLRPREFLCILPPNEFQYCCNPQKDRIWVKTRRMSHKPWPSIHGSTWARPREKIQYNPETSHKTVIFHLSGQKHPLNGLKWKSAMCRSPERNHGCQVQSWKFSGILMSLEVKIRPFPLTLHVGLNTVQSYRAACDTKENRLIVIQMNQHDINRRFKVDIADAFSMT